MTLGELDSALLKAHAANDINSLVENYAAAANLRESDQDTDGACFYLTHAYIFALQSGHPDIPVLNRRLYDHGREERYGW